MPANAAAPTPTPASYWVVPGRLCAGEYPGAAETTEARAKLRRFLDASFTFYLDLTEADERLEPYAALLQAEAAARGLVVEHRRLPIVDLGTPTPAETRQILDTLDAAIVAGHRVYVHCYGGIGRTGTIVGCYLVRHGLSGRQALAELERLRRGSAKAERASPEMSGQWRRVRYWKVGE